MKTKTVITYGIFDMFHTGHIKLLKHAKETGDRLLVAISIDAFNRGKREKPLIPCEQRVEIVANIKGVDLVISERNWDQKPDNIRQYDVDILVIGGDRKGRFDSLALLCEVVYLPRTKHISSIQLKKSLTQFLTVSKEEILKVFESIDILRQDFE